ncbi:MAG: hypothetical protein GY711_07205 [bacterium]|nr:hypothetical protein [bacterium]
MRCPYLVYAVAAGSCFAAAAHGQTPHLWSQSTDNTSLAAGSPACLDHGTFENGLWRVYDPLAEGWDGDFQISVCRFGVEAAATTGGSQLVTVQLFANPAPGAPAAPPLPLLGSADVVVADTVVTNQTFVTVQFDPPVYVPGGTPVAVKVCSLDGHPQGDYFFIGSNTAGETPADSSYISSFACGIVDPVPVSSVGFPVHWVIDLVCERLGDPGTPYCETNINSSGAMARILAIGSRTIADNDFGLRTLDLPLHQPGYFLMSETQAFVPYAGGTLGVLCLGLPLVRFSQDVLDSGATGRVDLVVDLTQLPGGTVVHPGDTWNFQYWFRDIGNTSNLSNATTVVFE